MTDEMLQLARANAEKAGATNVQLLKGTIEDIPLPDGSIDAVISNCVINFIGRQAESADGNVRVLRRGRIGS